MKRSINEDSNINIFDLSPELIYQILLNLDIYEINTICSTNKLLESYCHDDFLWREKYINDKLKLSFIDVNNVNADIYKLAYHILDEGNRLFNKIINKYLQFNIYINLPIISDNTWIINEYLPINNIYTGILKLTMSYIPRIKGSHYIYQKILYYNKNDINYISDTVSITEQEIIEILGYIIYSGYKLLGKNSDSYSFVNDDEPHDYDILNSLLNIAYL